MRGRSNTEAPHQVADSTDLVDWVVKVLLCDRPPPHLAYPDMKSSRSSGLEAIKSWMARNEPRLTNGTRSIMS